MGIMTAGAGITLCGLRPSIPLVALGLVVMLAGAALLTSAAGTLYQTEVPRRLQGRLSALRRVTAEGLLPVAVLAVAPVAEGLAEPAMAEGGALAGTVGVALGTGPGRGIALLFVLVGLSVIVLGLALGRDRVLARLDRREEPRPPKPTSEPLWPTELAAPGSRHGPHE